MCEQLDAFWTSTTLKQMYFVRDVRRLPVLLLISSVPPSTLIDNCKGRQLVHEFQEKANTIVDVGTNNAAWGGEQAAQRLAAAQVLISSVFHANSALAMVAPGLVSFLEAPSH